MDPSHAEALGVVAVFALLVLHYALHQRNARKMQELDERHLQIEAGMQEQISDLQSTLDRVRSANGSLAQSVTLMAELFARMAPSVGTNRSEFDTLIDTLHRNLREQGLSITATGDVNIGGDAVGGSKRVGG